MSRTPAGAAFDVALAVLAMPLLLASLLVSWLVGIAVSMAAIPRLLWCLFLNVSSGRYRARQTEEDQ